MATSMAMDSDLHRYFGVELNNATWSLLTAGGLPDDAPEPERARLLYGAYASLFHWMSTPSGTVANRVRGEHLVSRAATAVGLYQLGEDHARRCLELCVTYPMEVEDWDVAFAHEAVARATAGQGDLETARRHHAAATEAGAEIADPEDRRVFLEEFARGPWFGLTGG